MGELDDFLTETLARHVEAAGAIHNGDVIPWTQIWSTSDPVTLFKAWGPCNSGWDEVSRTSYRVASRFSDCTGYSLDLDAAGVRGTWPKQSALNAEPFPSTARCPSLAASASPTSMAARTANGRSSTATATTRPPIRAQPQRRSSTALPLTKSATEPCSRAVRRTQRAA